MSRKLKSLTQQEEMFNQIISYLLEEFKVFAGANNSIWLLAVLVNFFFLTLPLLILYAFSYRISLLRFPLYGVWLVNSLILLSLAYNSCYLSLTNQGSLEIFDFLNHSLSTRALEKEKIFGKYSAEIDNCINGEGKFKEQVHESFKLSDNIPLKFHQNKEEIDKIYKETVSHESEILTNLKAILEESKGDLTRMVPAEKTNSSTALFLDDLNKMTDSTYLGSKVTKCSTVTDRYVTASKDCPKGSKCIVLTTKELDLKQIMANYQQTLSKCAFNKNLIVENIKKIQDNLRKYEHTLTPLFRQVNR